MSNQPQSQNQTQRLAKCYASLRSSVEINYNPSAATFCDDVMSTFGAHETSRQARYVAHLSGLLKSAVLRGPPVSIDTVQYKDRSGEPRSRIRTLKTAPTEKVFRQMCEDARTGVSDEESGWMDEPRSYDEALESAEDDLRVIQGMKPLSASATEELGQPGGGAGLRGVSRALLTVLGLAAAGTMAYLWLTGEEDEYDEYLDPEY